MWWSSSVPPTSLRQPLRSVHYANRGTLNQPCKYRGKCMYYNSNTGQGCFNHNVIWDTNPKDGFYYVPIRGRDLEYNNKCTVQLSPLPRGPPRTVLSTQTNCESLVVSYDWSIHRTFSYWLWLIRTDLSTSTSGLKLFSRPALTRMWGPSRPNSIVHKELRLLQGYLHNMKHYQWLL